MNECFVMEPFRNTLVVLKCHHKLQTAIVAVTVTQYIEYRNGMHVLIHCNTVNRKNVMRMRQRQAAVDEQTAS